MTVAVPHYRWSAAEFVRAWEAGAFDARVELVEGEVWPVLSGNWHGDAVGNVFLALGRCDRRATTSTVAGTAGPGTDVAVDELVG